MKVVSSTAVRAIAMYYVIHVEEDLILTEDYCFTWLRVKENNKHNKANN